MAMKKEALTNLIADDLASRNDNWTEIDNTFALKADKQQEAWITPTLLNGWAVRSGNTVQYRKNNSGVVFIQGQITPGAGAMFTLPAGYMPSHPIVFTAPTSGGAFVTVWVAGYQVGLNTGTVGTYVDLSSIVFMTI